MDVNRIQNIGPGVLKLWQTVLLAGLPLAVVAAGLTMFVKRRG